MRRLRRTFRSFLDLYSLRRTLPFRYLASEFKLWYHGGVLRDINLTDKSTDRHALVTHLVRPFLINEDSYLFKKHQSNWKPVELVRALNNHGYSADVHSIRRHVKIEEPERYSLLLGTNPHFFTYSKTLPESTVRVFYNAGMHWRHQNEALERRRDALEDRRGIRIQEARTANEFDVGLADYIIVIGDERTRESYERELPDSVPVYNITVGTFDELNALRGDGDVDKRFPECKRNFLWLGSSGPVLKGLDLVLEAFAELPDYDLHVCGPLDEGSEFVREYHEELHETDNIHYHGWVDIFSEAFFDLADSYGFHILASASEGISGAVVNTMHRGVIPITTEAVGVDTGDFGFRIDDEVESIKRTVREASSLSEDEIVQRSRTAAERACERYSREQFVTELDDAISQILEREDQLH